MCDEIIRVGKYVVRVGLRPDNPAFPQFLVYRGDKFIGKQFSVPCESDCDWLARQADAHSPQYAPRSKPARKHSTGGYNTRNATKLQPA